MTAKFRWSLPFIIHSLLSSNSWDNQEHTVLHEMSSPGTVYIYMCQISTAIQCWHQIGIHLYWGGLNLSQDIGYPGWGSHGFPLSLQENARIVPRLRQDCFLHNHFQYIIHQPFYHLTLYRLDTDSTIKQPTHNLALAQSSDLGWYQKQCCLVTSSWQTITHTSSFHITFQFNQIH